MKSKEKKDSCENYRKSRLSLPIVVWFPLVVEIQLFRQHFILSMDVLLNVISLCIFFYLAFPCIPQTVQALAEKDACRRHVSFLNDELVTDWKICVFRRIPQATFQSGSRVDLAVLDVNLNEYLSAGVWGVGSIFQIY